MISKVLYQCPGTFSFNWGIFLNFFCTILYSILLHLPPLRFHCVGEYWDCTQDCCDSCHGQSGVLPYLIFTCNLMRNYSLAVIKDCLECKCCFKRKKSAILFSQLLEQDRIYLSSEFGSKRIPNLYSSLPSQQILRKSAKKCKQANHQNSLENRFASSPLV
jgi:hypothetical protein